MSSSILIDFGRNPDRYVRFAHRLNTALRPHTCQDSFHIFDSGAPVYKVFVSGLKWYTMYKWWEIVVYYENSMQELTWESAITNNLHNKLWSVPRLARNYQVC